MEGNHLNQFRYVLFVTHLEVICLGMLWLLRDNIKQKSEQKRNVRMKMGFWKENKSHRSVGYLIRNRDY